ncbi:hypothetical protein [Brevundimonas denitrificans]|uniref:hypothetical protein n=2 Tax=Brevundimonas TaxID=41275 RepID=UPI00223AADBE|nr:hypothetical protein [Brevundimonas denitrificans]
MPNILGHMSFSMIGKANGTDDRDKNLLSARRSSAGFSRLIVCQRERNLSDNLLFARMDGLVSDLDHSFRFTLTAYTTRDSDDDMGVLTGWATMAHLDQPIPSIPTREELRFGGKPVLRSYQQALIEGSRFAVAFRMLRCGRVNFRITQRFRSQIVLISDGKRIRRINGLRALSAQCFYFIRDVSHNHYHHSKNTDNITSVWEDRHGLSRGRWVRETLYELYKRVLLLRSVKHAKAQENALGILAYADAFERNIASKFRGRSGHSFIPEYDGIDIRNSLNVTLEAKRRLRIQHNVAAAVVPAVTVGLFAAANILYGSAPQDSIVGLSIGILKSNIAYIGAMWIGMVYFTLAVTGIIPSPSHLWPIKQIAQVASVKGRRGSSAIMILIAVIISVYIFILIR